MVYSPSTVNEIRLRYNEGERVFIIETAVTPTAPGATYESDKAYRRFRDVERWVHYGEYETFYTAVEHLYALAMDSNSKIREVDLGTLDINSQEILDVRDILVTLLG